MGTRSNIGIRNIDNTVTGIYCHWDGYPSHVGKILLDHYNDVDRVNALMELGDLSSLRIKLNPEPGKPHTYDEPLDDVCVAYGRDRGEKGVESKLFKTLSQFERYMDNSGAEYQYVFDTVVGEWTFRDYKSDWKQLTMEDCK
jgi:hypothetical protein